LQDISLVSSNCFTCFSRWVFIFPHSL
jgi:hypothetical protein